MAEIIEIVAPMAGVVESLPVAVGVKVLAGDALVVLQAMKMEFPVQTDQAGKIAAILVEEGQEVEMGAVLIHLLPD